jgi:hypothetical protein
MAHSGGPIACHKTIRVDEDWEQPNLRQCAGAATFRANAAISGRSSDVAIGPVDPEHVFTRSSDFLEHHGAPAEGTPEGRSALGKCSQIGSRRSRVTQRPLPLSSPDGPTT